MTVREFAKNNVTTECVEVRNNGKTYLCTLVEAILVFGEKQIKRIYERDNLILLSVK